MNLTWLKTQGTDCSLSIFVQAGAKTSGIVGEHGVWLKIRVAAPRTEGLANEHLLDYLAKVFALGKKDITIVKGEFGKHKILKIRNATADDLVLKVKKEIAQLSNGGKK